MLTFRNNFWIYVFPCLNMLLLLSRFSRVRLCATPWTAAHQAPPSLGFSRQEHWSGLPFPSPMHESEKWKSSRSVVSNSLQPHGLQPTRLLCPWDFPGKSAGVWCHCLLRVSIWAHFKCLNGQSFSSERSVQAETQIRGMTGETAFQEKCGRKMQLSMLHTEWS